MVHLPHFKNNTGVINMTDPTVYTVYLLHLVTVHCYKSNDAVKMQSEAFVMTYTENMWILLKKYFVGHSHTIKFLWSSRLACGVHDTKIITGNCYLVCFQWNTIKTI